MFNGLTFILSERVMNLIRNWISGLIFIAILLLHHTVFASHIEEEVRKINSNISILSTTRYQESLHPRLFIKMIYPVLISETEPNDIVDFFNQQISSILDTKIKYFKRNLPENNDRKDKKQNRLFIDYSAAILNIKNNPLISVRFAIQTFPLEQKSKTEIKVFNYDLFSGEEIQLSDLFHQDDHYLAVLGDYTHTQLKRRFGNSTELSVHTAPLAENFNSWNLQPEGLVIHFPAGRVAKPAYGIQSVLVPYAVFKGLLSDDSLITQCLKHPKNCRRLSILRGSFVEG